MRSVEESHGAHSLCMHRRKPAVLFSMRKLSFHVVGFAFWLWLLRLALRLKLAQALQHALPPGRLCLLFLGGFLFFPDLPLPCGKVTIVLLHDSLRLAVGCHERLHIGMVWYKKS